jgi:hypothetical protein
MMFFFSSWVHGVSYRFHALKISFLPFIIESWMWMDHFHHTGLRYASNSNIQLHGFTDSDWVGSANDINSTFGICFSLGSAMIS